MRTSLLLLTLLALLITPLSGLAAGPNRAEPLAFSVHDLDRDGYISREEYSALRAQCQERSRETAQPRGRTRCALLDFETLDANQDGRISEDELLDKLRLRYRGGRTP
jgi:Ca2+-binding EF-hand superfamily protein